MGGDSTAWTTTVFGATGGYYNIDVANTAATSATLVFSAEPVAPARAKTALEWLDEQVDSLRVRL